MLSLQKYKGNTAMLTDKIFYELVNAAILAPSADNMQPWEFRKDGDKIEVRCAKQRMLPTDVNKMFAWMGVGAAIQNILVAATARGLEGSVNYIASEQPDEPVGVISFSSGSSFNHLSQYIEKRVTNRVPFETVPLDSSLIARLTESISSLKAGIHWTTSASDFENISKMDANSSYIRLEYKPLHDELFDILRFNRKENELIRYGLDFKSLEVPPFAVFMARQLQYWSVNRLVSRLGIGKLVAKQLSMKLQKSGAICLLTAHQRSPVAYIEAGRAMEQLWLTATAEGLSVQPYGVLPQYLTKAEVEPETFLPEYVNIINSLRKPFYSVFPGAENECPAIVLRVGLAGKQSARSDVRILREGVLI